jgi:hypothetical protein
MVFRIHVTAPKRAAKGRSLAQLPLDNSRLVQALSRLRRQGEDRRR